MKIWLKLLATASVATLLSGCAFTDDSLKVNYQQTAVSTHALYSKQHTALAVATVRDSRDVSNPRMLIHKENMLGETTSGGYLAGQNVSTIVRTSLVKGLRQVGYQIKPMSAPYQLQTSLEDVNLQVVMGVIKGDVDINTRVAFVLIDSHQGTVLWQDSITGHGKVTTAWGGDKTIAQAFNYSLQDVVRQLQESSSLYHVLNK